MIKYKVKDKNRNISVLLSLTMNILFFMLVILITLFTTSFNFEALLPRWELWTRLPADLQGFWPWQKGTITVVPEGTPKAYWQPGVLVISGLIQVLGYFFFINTKWGRKLKLTLERVYLRNTKVLNKFRYLISDDKFRDELGKVDLQNKKDAWRLMIQEKLQKFVDKMPISVADELKYDESKQSKKTKIWLETQKRMRIQLNDDWIDENIHRLRIKYPRINVKMVVNGITDIEIAKMAITDVKSIEARENRNKLIFGMLSFVAVSTFAALSFPAFRQDIWMLIKDFVIYAAALIMNIIMGLMSANEVHEARIRETEDRKGYIEAHVGHEVFRKVEEEVDREVDRNDIKDLENELIRLKRE